MPGYFSCDFQAGTLDTDSQPFTQGRAPAFFLDTRMHPSELNGPGKYDDLATLVRESTQASGVAVIVVGGTKGAGFAVQGVEHFIYKLPDVLEDMARSIRAQRQLDTTGTAP